MEGKEIQHVVFDERQEQILRRLGLIGEGTQAFYRDACRMMAQPTMESTSHLVGHLFREIESSVRYVLQPLGPVRTATGRKTGESHKTSIRAALRALEIPVRYVLQLLGQVRTAIGKKTRESHKAIVRAVLRVLEIPESDRVAVLWLGLAHKLHATAHRDNLKPPRPVTDNERQKWQEFETLLDHVLEKYEEIYFKAHDYIDRLVESREGKKSVVAEFAKRCPHNQICLGYFFKKLDSTDWIEPLKKAGYFRTPPPPQETENGIMLPFWPESQYLARVAAQVPDKVLEVILAMEETSNSRVHSDLLDALCAMPAVTAAKARDRAVRWIESTSHLWFPQEFGQLIVHLAEGGETSAALLIARPLLALRSACGGVSEAESEDTFSPRREPIARCGNWEYRETIKKIVSSLAATAGTDALVLFCDLLEEAAALSLRETQDGGRSLLFLDWPSAIEEHEQNRHRDHPKDTLVFAVRDTAEHLMNTKGKETLDLLRSRKCILFQRIEMHLRVRWPELDLSGTASLLSDPAIYENEDLQHERYHLLRTVFGRLPRNAQDVYYEHIERGFPEGRYVQRRTEGDGKAPGRDDIEQARRHWQYMRLLPIEQYLTGERQALFDTLVKEFQEPEHPDFLSWSSTGFVEHKSPKGRGELDSMSTGQLVSYLEGFEPTDPPFFGSFAGLRTEIEGLVFSNPDRYAGQAQRFRGLRPSFIRAVLEGIKRSVKEGEGFQPGYWSSVLDLCAWVVQQAEDAPSGEEKYQLRRTEWRGVRKTVIDLLAAGFVSETSPIPWTLRDSVWAVLLPLTDDPDPSPDRDRDRAVFDPAALAVNAVRSMAVRKAIQYALWVRRHTEGQNAGEETGSPKGFDFMPEVREVLDRHLDPMRDPSLAVRSVYGEFFTLLACLDQNWGRDRLTRVFPREPEYLALREVAWTSYVIFVGGGFRPHVFEMLEEDYLWAINKIGSWTNLSLQMANPDEKLAEHLAVFCWHGEIELGDTPSVLSAFYGKAPASLRGHIIRFLGEQLQDKTLVLEPAVRNRLENLWLARIEYVRAQKDKAADGKELEGFGLWFASGHFDDAWAMRQLKNVLAITGTLEPDYSFMMELAEVANRSPRDAVECLRFIIEAIAKGGPAWEFLRWDETAKKILWSAVNSGQPEAREAAKALANKLAALGQIGYRDIAQS